MKNFKLSSGKEIPAIGYGTFRIPNESVNELILEALRAGYTHIDTASYYENETGIGQALSECDKNRSDLFITTKVWNEEIRNRKIKESCSESLEKLKTDYIDLLLYHWPVGNIIETWKDFEYLKKEGLVKHIGVSNFKEHHLDTLLKNCEIKPEINQIECHPLLNQKNLREYCNSKGILVSAWSGFMAGELLTNKELLSIGKRYKKTIAQIILRWNFQHNIITLPKSSSENRMRENLDIFDFHLSEEDMYYIDSMNRDQRCGPDPDFINF